MFSIFCVFRSLRSSLIASASVSKSSCKAELLTILEILHKMGRAHEGSERQVPMGSILPELHPSSLCVLHTPAPFSALAPQVLLVATVPIEAGQE